MKMVYILLCCVSLLKAEEVLGCKNRSNLVLVDVPSKCVLKYNETQGVQNATKRVLKFFERFKSNDNLKGLGDIEDYLSELSVSLLQAQSTFYDLLDKYNIESDKQNLKSKKNNNRNIVSQLFKGSKKQKILEKKENKNQNDSFNKIRDQYYKASEKYSNLKKEYDAVYEKYVQLKNKNILNYLNELIPPTISELKEAEKVYSCSEKSFRDKISKNSTNKKDSSDKTSKTKNFNYNSDEEDNLSYEMFTPINSQGNFEEGKSSVDFIIEEQLQKCDNSSIDFIVEEQLQEEKKSVFDFVIEECENSSIDFTIEKKKKENGIIQNSKFRLNGYKPLNWEKAKPIVHAKPFVVKKVTKNQQALVEEKNDTNCSTINSRIDSKLNDYKQLIWLKNYTPVEHKKVFKV